MNLASEVLTNEAKRRQFDAGTDISDLIAGFWEKLASRMQGKRAAATSGGDGPRVARGSGVALEELASEEERDRTPPASKSTRRRRTSCGDTR